MSRLTGLIAESERSTSKVLAKLEQLSGYVSEDIRLLVEHDRLTAEKIEQLGLDAADTTAEELYRALEVKLADDAAELARVTGYDQADRAGRAIKIATLAASAPPKLKILALKKNKAKELLRSNPPRHLMKKLNYRSLESMLKREDIAGLLCAAPLAEAASWNKKLIREMNRFKAADFEEREIEYLAMTDKKWSRWLEIAKPVNYAPIMAAVLVWPVKALDKDASISYILLALQAAEILEAESIYLKGHHFRADFGNLAARLYETGEQVGLEVEGESFFDWQSLKHLFSPKIDATHAFSSLHPALKWWDGARHAIKLGDKLVSVHLADVVSGALNGADFDNRVLHNGISAVKTGLLQRYLKYPSVRDYFLGQLDTTEYAFEESAEEQSISSDLEAGLI